MTGGLPLREALAALRRGIETACHRAGRRPEDVVLIAVTKTVPADTVRQAREIGVENFGENYAAELASKSAVVEARWHFIGKLQRGTAAKVADHANMVHSAEPGRGFERLARHAHQRADTIPCLVQVDFTGTRQGVAPDQTIAFIREAQAVKGIRLVGLMTLPPWTGDPEASRPYFARLRAMRDEVRGTWPGISELSMGMSGDYQVAIEEGATMLRVGTALFGDRRAGRALG